MERIKIEDWDCYQYAKKRGYEPLIDKRFIIDIDTRIDIQQRLFGKGHSPEENERFYRYCWDIYPHVCAECCKPLRQYSAVYISHIKTRGSHPELSHDCRNVNILCFEHHSMWEDATTRKYMRIYPSNLRVIEIMKEEYGN